MNRNQCLSLQSQLTHLESRDPLTLKEGRTKKKNKKTAQMEWVWQRGKRRHMIASYTNLSFWPLLTASPAQGSARGASWVPARARQGSPEREAIWIHLTIQHRWSTNLKHQLPTNPQIPLWPHLAGACWTRSFTQTLKLPRLVSDSSEQQRSVAVLSPPD